MRIDCMNCNKGMNLDHPVFEEYQGPVKCFHCGMIMDVDITEGRLQTSSSQGSELPAVQEFVSGMMPTPWIPPVYARG